MIFFKSIKFKNFLSTGNYFTEINLCNSTNTLVVGTNGAGNYALINLWFLVVIPDTRQTQSTRSYSTLLYTSKQASKVIHARNRPMCRRIYSNIPTIVSIRGGRAACARPGARAYMRPWVHAHTCGSCCGCGEKDRICSPQRAPAIKIPRTRSN